MSDLVGVVVGVIQAGGMPAAIAGGIVGLVLAIIVLARIANMMATGKTEAQAVALQGRLLETIDRYVATEEALRRRLDGLVTDNTSLREEIVELRATLSLIRNQRRKLIEIMREIKADKLGPAAIRAAAIEVGA